jgi:hypothetical protein
MLSRRRRNRPLCQAVVSHPPSARCAGWMTPRLKVLSLFVRSRKIPVPAVVLSEQTGFGQAGRQPGEGGQAVKRHRRYSVGVPPRHGAVLSPSVSDRALSDFIAERRWDVNLGSPPDSLGLASRMRWRPAGAGHWVLVFAAGMLVLTRQARKRLPGVPPPVPEPARVRAGQALLSGAHAATPGSLGVCARLGRCDLVVR